MSLEEELRLILWLGLISGMLMAAGAIGFLFVSGAGGFLVFALGGVVGLAAQRFYADVRFVLFQKE